MEKSFFSYALFAILMFGVSGCKSRQIPHSEKAHSDESVLPPNCVRVNENLFVDKTEVCNLDYREYLYWLIQVYGYNSITHKQSLPDTLVWRETLSYGEPMIESYFRHPAYNSYPMVGISFEQAQKFCDWRTDRVYEMILIKLGRIQPNSNQDSAGHFTAARYRSGRYAGYAPDLSVPIPRYRLPKEAEWELAASGGLDIQQFPYGYDFDSPHLKKMSKRYQHLLSTKEAADRLGSKYPAEVENLFTNNFGIYNMIGNVAEMVSEHGMAKGGSYIHPAGECNIANKIACDKPTHWLGFRCICSWEKE